MNISDRVKLLRGVKTLEIFAKEHNTNASTIHNYENGRKPSADFLESLAEKGININWVLTGEGQVYLTQPTPKRKPSKSQPGIPILTKCPAGKPQAWFELTDVTDAPRISDLLRHGEFDFALTVQGDSMFPYIYNDDVIVVSPDLEAKTGDIVVARIGDEVTVKRLRLGKIVTLMPENAKHPTIEIPRVEVELLGRVTSVVRSVTRNGRHIYDYETVELLKDVSIARLAVELEKLPEEFREALRGAVQKTGPQPSTDPIRLATWCQKVLRKAQDEIDSLFGV